MKKLLETTVNVELQYGRIFEFFLSYYFVAMSCMRGTFWIKYVAKLWS